MFDAIVVGGGIIGSLSAWRLQQRGLSVCLLDAEHAGAASIAAAGILGAQAEAEEAGPLFAFGLRARTAHAVLDQELRTLTGRDTGYRVYGALVSGIDLGWQRQYHLRLERLGAEWFCPDEGQVDPPALRLAVRHACEIAGVKTRRDSVLSIGEGFVQTATERIAAGLIVIAAGAWTQKLVPDVDIEPVHGILCELRCSEGGAPIRFSKDSYMVTRGDGRVTAGFTSESIGFSHVMTDAQRAELRHRIAVFAPELAGIAPERYWCGLRPRALRGAPVIDRQGNIIIATGQYRNGILHAPLVADCVSALAMGEVPPVDLQFFSLSSSAASGKWSESSRQGEPSRAVVDTALSLRT